MFCVLDSVGGFCDDLSTFCGLFGLLGSLLSIWSFSSIRFIFVLSIVISLEGRFSGRELSLLSVLIIPAPVLLSFKRKFPFLSIWESPSLEIVAKLLTLLILWNKSSSILEILITFSSLFLSLSKHAFLPK